jgi:hypothetical protein
MPELTIVIFDVVPIFWFAGSTRLQKWLLEASAANGNGLIASNKDRPFRRCIVQTSVELVRPREISMCGKFGAELRLLDTRMTELERSAGYKKGQQWWGSCPHFHIGIQHLASAREAPTLSFNGTLHGRVKCSEYRSRNNPRFPIQRGDEPG